MVVAVPLAAVIGDCVVDEVVADPEVAVGDWEVEAPVLPALVLMVGDWMTAFAVATEGAEVVLLVFAEVSGIMVVEG